MNLTETQRRVLRHIEDGQWWSARDIHDSVGTRSNAILETLVRKGLLEHAWPKDVPGIAAGWRITPQGRAKITAETT